MDVSCFSNSGELFVCRNVCYKQLTKFQRALKKVKKIVTKEVAELCSKRNPSILRKCEKEDLEKFDLQLVCNEWRERAPVFYSFLLTSAVIKRKKIHGGFEALLSRALFS